MAGNILGELFKVVSFGESHGPALGCVIDGCPAGLELSVEDIARELRRRRPAQGGASTTRSEADEPEILSGVFEGKTLGTPIAILVRNTDSHSADYDNLRNVYRPGHADFCWDAKYGIRDHRGGGRSSGRETLCRVAAGAVAHKLLTVYGIQIKAWTSALAGIDMPRPDSPDFDFDEIEQNPLRIPGRAAAETALKVIETLRTEGDSVGGIVSCLAQGVTPGLGEPVFGKLDARLAGAMLSLGAVKGVEFGAGFAAARLKGSENNDTPANKTNNAGGILGGISSGQDIIFNVAFKPTPSIAQPQKAFSKTGSEAVDCMRGVHTPSLQGGVVDLVISGRHDVCIAPRAVPVVEAMTALILADMVLMQRSARL
ncbi:MAG: chorismate synthase [Treponema sp.]|jgi:chorismate synthase|nr:chorismate synthase [Treponema sp.]